MSKISIIVPVYNSGKYLTQCLDSIFNQTYKDFELIVINDGSKDNSLRILLDYQKLHSNMIIINNEVNMGAGKSRNEGIDISTGEYIMFVDSDDYIVSTTLEEAYKCAVNNSSDLVRYDFNRVIGKKEFCYAILNPKLQKKEQKIDLAKDDYIFKETPGACNKLFSSKLIGDTRFPVGILFEDFPFNNSIIFKAENIFYLKETLYKYRFNPKSTMGSNLFHVNPRLLDFIEACDRFDESTEDKKGLDDMVKSMEKIWCVNIINDLILWKEFSIKQKQMLYSYLIKLIELKYGKLDGDYAYESTKTRDPFFKKRMELMIKYIIKSEYQQDDNIDKLKKKSLIVMNNAKK